MAIKLEIEWNVDNLRTTAKYFLSTPAAKRPIGVVGPLVTVEDAESFLLARVQQLLVEPARVSAWEDLNSDLLSLAPQFFLIVKATQSPTYQGDDRVTSGSSSLALREHRAISRKDRGILASRTYDLPGGNAMILLFEIMFLTRLLSNQKAAVESQ